jgi:anti-anti-sigma regulatory factor
VTLTVDLSAVEYLDSAAINALFRRADHIDLIAHPALMPVLAISGLSELVTIESAPPTAAH